MNIIKIVLTSIICLAVTFSPAAAANYDFDGSAGLLSPLSGISLSGIEVASPGQPGEVSENRKPNSAVYHWIDYDIDGRYYSGSSGRDRVTADGRKVEDVLKAAGYAITRSEAVRNGDNWRYVLGFMSRSGSFPGDLKYHIVEFDSGYNRYVGWSSKDRLARDADKFISGLKAAGFMVLHTHLNYYKDYDSWSRTVFYIAPAGRVPPENGFYRKIYDANYNKYTGWQGKDRLQRDAALAENSLRAAGYVVLYSRMEYFKNDDSYQFMIQYVSPVGQVLGPIQRYTLEHDGNYNLYTTWQGFERLKADAAALRESVKKAGYIVLADELVYFKNNDSYVFRMEYLAPAGSFPEAVRVHNIVKDGGGRLYTGWSGKSRLESDARSFMENLRLLDNVVLQSRFEYYKNTDSWGYRIFYLQSL